jgi:hypothetical protein
LRSLVQEFVPVRFDANEQEKIKMSLWIVKGSDFVDTLKRAFQEHDQANLDYLMTEFIIADHGVTKRQKFRFSNGASNLEIAPNGPGQKDSVPGEARRLKLILARSRKSKVTLILLWIFSLAPASLPASDNSTPASRMIPAGAPGKPQNFGLFPAETFRIATGACKDCPAPKQALWYFENEIIAVPQGESSAAGLLSDSAGYEKILERIKEQGPQSGLSLPSLIWLGSPEIISRATLSSDGKTLQTGNGEEIPFSLVEKISTNRSYYDPSSVEFFRRRSLRVRGATHLQNGNPRFIARTIWPEDFRVDTNHLPPQGLRSGESVNRLITHNSGEAKGRFEARLLWERSDQRDRAWDGLPVLGMVLSGGQGDDDESQAGHVAIVTGKVGANGEMADWLVNNFYNLDEVSEKGIIASMLPLDNYLADLNSGQSYYRPTYLLVVVLKDSRAADRFQAAIQPLYNHFYRHDFLYHHSKTNCTGISIDTLRAVGWQIPHQGATGYLKAAAAFAYLSATDRSFASGKKMFDYLSEEQTRLFPRAAFEAAAEDALEILSGQSRRRLTDYESALRDDAVAVLFVRIPQIPSSRAFGTYPIASFDEYRNRVPADRSQWKIVPVDARPFPDDLRDPLPNESRPGIWGYLAASTAVVSLVWVVSRKMYRRRFAAKNFS